MNLPILAKFVILIWLPLAELQGKDQHNSFPNKTKSLKHEEENLVEKVKKQMEKNSVKIMSLVTKRNFSGDEKVSANELYLENEYSVNSEGNLTSAHKYKGSVKKDLSALSRVKNESAIKLKNVKTKVRKRKTLLDISVGEDPHSPDDYEEEDIEDIELRNNTEMGGYLGAPCEETCSEKLFHVVCDPKSRICECEDKYPVRIRADMGCEKPKQLGDQCFYAETCSFFDSNAECVQINHNAICKCKPGFHAVALRKGVKRMFCSEDVEVVSADLTTLLGVATGIAVLTGLICFVLRLFSGNRYPATRHYANANIAPPLLLSSDNQWINGIPLTVHGRPSSRSSCQRSTTSLAQYPRNKGVLVPASRAGAARAAAILLIPCHLQATRNPEVINNNDDAEVQLNDVEHTTPIGSRRHSFSSVQSNTSSQKSMSYSARRFEQENQQREHRAAMRAAREEAVRPSPSPLSTNGLITSFSKDTEEDPLCAHNEDPALESEPPAFSITQGIMLPNSPN